jgi:hypothetical protein
MDPYLEQRWGDFHASVITYMRDALQPGLPEGLRARMGERVYVETLGGRERQVIPDVHVHETPYRPGIAAHPAPARAGPAVAEPILVSTRVEVTERFVQIIDIASGGRVVTVIEVLSPANKRSGHGRSEYQRKQSECIRGNVNLVEIDMVRAGEHVTLVNLDGVDPLKVAAYLVSVYRPSRRGLTEYYPLPLRERLPHIRIPLRATDPDAVLDLQAVVDTSYERGRYDDIDYSRPLHPPLDPADQEWAAQLLERK